MSSEQHLLVERFIASFEKVNYLRADPILDPIAWQLAIGEPDRHGCKHWRPIKVSSDISALELIYKEVGVRLPPLFEFLLLSYRWAEVDLRLFTLLANPPNHGLDGFLHQMSKDQAIWKYLRQAGYVQFGKGSGGDYDPVCFDRLSRAKNGDYAIIKIDHEEILCNNRVKITAELAPSFEQLMMRTINQVRLH